MVKKRAEEKIADIERKIHTLREMKDALAKLTAAYRGKGPTNECPIIEAFHGQGDEKVLPRGGKRR